MRSYNNKKKLTQTEAIGGEEDEVPVLSEEDHGLQDTSALTIREGNENQLVNQPTSVGTQSSLLSPKIWYLTARLYALKAAAALGVAGAQEQQNKTILMRPDASIHQPEVLSTQIQQEPENLTDILQRDASLLKQRLQADGEVLQKRLGIEGAVIQKRFERSTTDLKERFAVNAQYSLDMLENMIERLRTQLPKPAMQQITDVDTTGINEPFPSLVEETRAI